MKKYLIIFSLLATVLASCQKNVSGTPSEIDRLETYSYNLFTNRVAIPVLSMDLVYELNTFLGLSPEERKHHFLANLVTQYDTNKYAIMIYSTLNSFIVDTGGTDFFSPGSEWGIYIETYAVAQYYGYEYVYGKLGAQYKLKCTDLGLWTVREEDGKKLSDLRLNYDNEMERSWGISCNFEETDGRATGIKSEAYTIGPDRLDGFFEVCMMKHKADIAGSYSLNGIMEVDVYSFDELKERAFVIGRPGFALSCVTETVKNK